MTNMSYPEKDPTEQDLGPVPSSTKIDRMILVLKRSPEKETDLVNLLKDQQSQKSSAFHKWISPEQFGEKYGASPSDLTSLTSYLANTGLHVDKLFKNQMAIQFSGDAGHISRAFKVQVHSYQSSSHTRMGLAGTPALPASLSAHAIGIVESNPHVSSSSPRPKAIFNRDSKTPWTLHAAATGRSQAVADIDPETAFDPGFLAVTPGDLGPLYGVPYYSGSQSMNGAGVTIGIVGDSNVNLAYISNFQTTFGLPANLPSVILAGPDPGITSDAFNSYSEIEMVNAAAPNANLLFYTAASTDIDTGLDFAFLQAVNDDQVQVLEVSTQECEAFAGTANALWGILWEQAAAEGISGVASSGNSGSAACDNSFEVAFSGLAVNGLASSPYVAAVGGTDFYYGSQPDQSTYNQYWGTTSNALVNVLTQIPEQPWNDALGINQAGYTPSNFATGGGLSSLGLETFNEEGEILSQAPYPQPYWQSSVVPTSLTSTARALPDVSLFSADGYNYSAYVFCAEASDCTTGSGTNLTTLSATAGGGTQASAALFAGMMALVVQKNGPQGNPNPVLYSLSKTTPSIFNEITVGNNSVACEEGSPNCSNGELVTSAGTAAYSASGTYNAATGLGSVNATKLVNTWASQNTASSQVTLSVTSSSTGLPVTTINHGDSVNISVSVTGSGPVPTGDVAILTTSHQPANLNLETLTLSAGAASGTTNLLSGGTYSIYARYAGDQDYGVSTSAPIVITVNAVPSAIHLESSTIANGSSVPYGTPLRVTVGVFDNIDVGSPSGAMTVFDNGTPIFTDPLDAEGYLTSTTALIPPGSHSISWSYAGGPGYEPSTLTSALSFTITPQTTQISLIPDTTTLTSANGVLGLTAIVTAPAQTMFSIPPGGTISVFTSSGEPLAGVGTDVYDIAGLPSGIGGPATVVPTAVTGLTISGSVLHAGTNSLYAVYTPSTGEPFTGSTSAPITITVDSAAATTVPSISMTTTVPAGNGVFDYVSQIPLAIGVTGGSATPTGTVAMFANGAAIGLATSTGAGTWSYDAVPEGYPGLPVGPIILSALYEGDSTHAPTSTNLNLLLVDDTSTADFSMVPTAVEQDVEPSSSATFALTFAALNGLSSTIGLSYSAPPGMSCSFASPGSVTVSSWASLNMTCNTGTLAVGLYRVQVVGNTTILDPYVGITHDTTVWINVI